MTSLGELREALDKIDNEIAELYEKRMEVCRKVGEYKVKSGKKVFDRQREKEKLADVMSKVEGDFNKKGIQELYQQLMSMSRKLQYICKFFFFSLPVKHLFSTPSRMRKYWKNRSV